MPLLASLQLALYALLWAVGWVALKNERPAIVQWVGYALASAASAALLGWRPDGPVWLTHTGSSAATVLSLILAGRGVLLFLGLRPNDRFFLAIASTAALGLGWVGPYDTDSRVALMAFFSIVVLVGVLLQSARRFMREFGYRLSAAAAFPVLALVGLNAYFLMLGLARGVVNIVGPGAVPLATWVVTLISAAAFNFLFLFLVGFRMHQDLRRQAGHDATTGLPMAERLRAAVERVTLTSPTGEAIALSASFGVSGWLPSDQHSEAVLRRADNAMYEAKRKGRNCVVLQTA